MPAASILAREGTAMAPAWSLLGRLFEGMGALRVVWREEFSKLVRRAVGARRVPPAELPYKVDERRFKPFSARDTIFARARREPKLASLREMLAKNRAKNILKGVPGYTFADYGLSEAARVYCGSHRMAIGRRSRPRREVTRNVDPGLLTSVVKRAAFLFGADLVGVAEPDPRWFYVESAPRLAAYSRVIVLAFEMEKPLVDTANEGPYAAEVAWGYSRMSITAASLACFLQTLGFEAEPQGNESALSIPLAIMAGLGEQGRSGLLLTPEFGPRVRLAKVFTTAPLVPDGPIRFGVWEFCPNCSACARACIVKAIPEEGPCWDGPTPSEQKGVFKWHVNHERCYEGWAKFGRGCGLCIKACPFGGRLWEEQRRRALERALSAAR